MKENFAIPAVGAIIAKKVGDEEYILVQNRKKNNGDGMDGLLEIPAGKIREYENIFEALRREVWEETGLHLTTIQGEEASHLLDVIGNKTIMFSPYCVTQNLSGAYSIILSTFLCEAEGELLKQTNETENIRWMKRDTLKEIVDNSPESIFLMHVHALKKIFEINCSQGDFDMAKIIAVCGKICSGKTYYSNQIKEKEKAVILSCDELTKDLFDNDLGEKHDEMALRIWNYFKKKSVELVNAGCTVILDWGFWSSENRKSLTEFYRKQNIPCEWHYIDVDDRTWHRNIEERNRRVLSGEGSSDYYLDEGLMDKLVSQWEAPSRDEIDVWYTLKS